MSILKVTLAGHPTLTKKAKELSISEIKSSKTQDLINNMIETMRDSEGVGIAAPQVFQPLRIFVMENKVTKKSSRKESIPLTIAINPRILNTSKILLLDQEGCLSLTIGTTVRGIVPRYKEIEIEGYNRKGIKFKLRAKNLAARIIQHEIDHLDGMLYLSRIRQKDMKYISTTENWIKFHKKKWQKPVPLK